MRRGTERARRRLGVALVAAAVALPSWGVTSAAEDRPPSAPTIVSAEIDFQEALVAWTSPSHDTDVAEYRFFVNGRLVGTQPFDARVTAQSRVHYPRPSETSGSWWIQVQAVDRAGNASVKSAPSRVDFELRPAPTMPTVRSVGHVVNGCVSVAFDEPISDDPIVAVVVTVNGLPGGRTESLSSHRICFERPGPKYLQFTAVTEYRSSYRTPPVRVDVDSIDRRAPSEPVITGDAPFIDERGRTAVAIEFTVSDADVESCVLLRNLQRTFVDFFSVQSPGVQRVVDGGYAEDLLAGSVWWYQVQCADAAGNQSVRSAPWRVDVSSY